MALFLHGFAAARRAKIDFPMKHESQSFSLRFVRAFFPCLLLLPKPQRLRGFFACATVLAFGLCGSGVCRSL